MKEIKVSPLYWIIIVISIFVYGCTTSQPTESVHEIPCAVGIWHWNEDESKMICKTDDTANQYFWFDSVSMEVQISNAREDWAPDTKIVLECSGWSQNRLLGEIDSYPKICNESGNISIVEPQ